MNVLMIIFFILMAVTIVVYAAMVRKQADKDEFMQASGTNEKKGERRQHSALH